MGPAPSDFFAFDWRAPAVSGPKWLLYWRAGAVTLQHGNHIESRVPCPAEGKVEPAFVGT